MYQLECFEEGQPKGVDMKKCKHKKVILASAVNVEFIPDQEPYTEGIEESCGIDSITIEAINIHYCPKCKVAQDIEIDGEIEIWT